LQFAGVSSSLTWLIDENKWFVRK